MVDCRCSITSLFGNKSFGFFHTMSGGRQPLCMMRYLWSARSAGGIRSADSDELDVLFHCACQIRRHIVHDLLQLGPDFRFIKRIYDLLRAIDVMLHFRYREIYRIVL